MDAWPDKPRLLISYAYQSVILGVIRNTKDMPLDLIVDSGAFTAASAGKVIDLNEYAEFLREHQSRISHAVTLDVIGDWRATAKNHDLMQARLPDMDVVPTWHIGSPEHELRRLCRDFNYVAIGGAVPYAKYPKILMKHLIRVHQIAREADTRLHGLGITGKTAMMRLPWHSVDSSAWTRGHRYGGIDLTDARGQMQSVTFGTKLSMKHRQLVRAYDGDPDLIETPGFNLRSSVGDRVATDSRWVCEAAARSFMLAEVAAHRKNQAQMRLHLASTNANNLTWGARAWNLGSPFKKRGEQ